MRLLTSFRQINHKKNVMKKVLYILVMLVVPALTAETAHAQKENREVQNFDEVVLAISADCYLTQGSGFECRLEGDESVLSEVETTISGTTLKIKYNKPWQFRNPKRIKVYITMPSLQAFTITGSGDVIAKESIEADDLQLMVTGSGDFLMEDLKVRDLEAKISGSGSIVIGGDKPGDELEVKITGSGEYEGDELAFKQARVAISGSGDTYVRAEDKLEIKVTGSGNVYYYGNALVDARVVGSGHVRKR